MTLQIVGDTQAAGQHVPLAHAPVRGESVEEVVDGTSGKRSGRKLVIRVLDGGVDVRLVDGVPELGPVLLVRLSKRAKHECYEL